jgi:DNA-binding NtrC family response regulator
LRNCIESTVVLAKGKILQEDDIPSYIREPEGSPAAGLAALSGGNLNNAEQELIRQALTVNNGNREGAAKMLGISERTLYRKIRRYGLN